MFIQLPPAPSDSATVGRCTRTQRICHEGWRRRTWTSSACTDQGCRLRASKMFGLLYNSNIMHLWTKNSVFITCSKANGRVNRWWINYGGFRTNTWKFCRNLSHQNKIRNNKACQSFQGNQLWTIDLLYHSVAMPQVHWMGFPSCYQFKWILIHPVYTESSTPPTSTPTLVTGMGPPSWRARATGRSTRGAWDELYKNRSSRKTDSQ